MRHRWLYTCTSKVGHLNSFLSLGVFKSLFKINAAIREVNFHLLTTGFN